MSNEDATVAVPDNISNFRPPKDVTDAALRFFSFWYHLGALSSSASKSLPAFPEDGEDSALDEEVRSRLSALARELAVEGVAPVDPETIARIVIELHTRDLGGPESVNYLLRQLDSQSTFRVLVEISFCSLYNAYLTYIGDLLGIVFRVRPKTMRLNAQVSYKDVLSFDSMEDLTHYLAEKRVYGLSRSDIGSLNNEIDKTIGLKLFESEEMAHSMGEIAAIRNLLVHRGGIIDRRFLKQIGIADESQLGRRYEFEPFRLAEAMQKMADSVCDIDDRSVQKFGLPVRSLVAS